MPQEFTLSPSPLRRGVVEQVRLSLKDRPYYSAGQTAYDSGTGFWLGVDNGTPKLSIGNSAGNKLTWDGTTLSVTGTLTATVGAIGGFDIGSDYVRDAANSFGLASTVTIGDDIRFWAGAAFANRATAPFRVTEAGAVAATNIQITSGDLTSSIINTAAVITSKLNDLAVTTAKLGDLAVTTGKLVNSAVDSNKLANLAVTTAKLVDSAVTSAKAVTALTGWTFTGTFSSTDANTVAWTAGTFITSSGSSVSVLAGNTGDMLARTYVYFDGTTVLKTTTTQATATADSNIVVAAAINGTGQAEFQVYGGVGGLKLRAADLIVSNSITASQIQAATITSTEIAANTIVAGNIAANTITANELAANSVNTSELVAGAVTAGKLSVSQLSAIAADMGTINAGSISVVNGANTIGLTPAGANAIFSGTTGSPQFKVTPAGVVTASDITITGGSVATSTLSGLVALANTNLAAQGWTQTSAFSVQDADTVQWVAGTFTSASGTAYSIFASNTGNMLARTYIYLDIAISTTAYQVTTTLANAVGAGKVLVATAMNGTVEPTFEVFSGAAESNLNGSSIVASSITGNEIAANTITAGKLSVSQLSAIAADMGALTAGTITLNTAGHIKGGQTGYNTGTGFFLGQSGGLAKFSIGSPSTNFMTWDGTLLTLSGIPTVRELISTPTTIPAGFQMMVADRLVIDSDLTIDGTLAIV